MASAAFAASPFCFESERKRDGEGRRETSAVEGERGRTWYRTGKKKARGREEDED